MYTRLRLLLYWLVVTAFIVGRISSECVAQSIVRDAPIATPTADAFAIGKTLAKSNTLEIGTLDELITRVAGEPSIKAFLKYGRNFDAYWESSKTQRAGKVFEAIAAFTENRRLARSGDSMRLLPTAAEGNPGHAADILLSDANLVVQEHHQYKLGWQAARDALTETKYAGMTIVTPADQMEILERELAKAEAKATRRGLPLAFEWGFVREALQEGRITARLPSRAMVPTRNDILTITRRQLQAQWTRLGRMAESTGMGRVLDAGPISGRLKVLGKAGRWTLVVLDLAGTGYQTYSDVLRYRIGEIGGNYLATKSSMRGVQLGLAYYTFCAPDPTLITKLAMGVAVIVLIAADNISDRVYEARRDQARCLLETIDRDERVYAARKQLLQLKGH
jgi:hypothetical protein